MTTPRGAQIKGIGTPTFEPAPLLLLAQQAGRHVARHRGCRAAGAIVDATGAGDAFGGAYAACRLLGGQEPVEAARRTRLAAIPVIGTRGAESALTLGPPEISRLPPVEASPP